MNLCHTIAFINNRPPNLHLRSSNQAPSNYAVFAGEKTGDGQGLTAVQILNQIHSHQSPHPGSSSSLNTQFVPTLKRLLTWRVPECLLSREVHCQHLRIPNWMLQGNGHQAVRSVPYMHVLSPLFPAIPIPWHLLTGMVAPARSPNHPSNSFIIKGSPGLKTMLREHVMCINVDTSGQGGKKLNTPYVGSWSVPQAP